MKTTGSILIFTIAIFALSSMVCYGQFREDVNRGDYSGPVVQQQRPEPGDWSNLFNMKMSHSYSMSFMSMGGQYRNVNAYTNSMDFFFTDRLTGELDISLMHSPFGQGFSNNNNQMGMGMGMDVVIRNAELNYQIGEKSSISIQFQQHPYGGFGTNPFDRYGYGYGFNRY